MFPKTVQKRDSSKQWIFVKRNQQTNIILITIPHKLNLYNLSGVNKEVKAYNRNLSSIVNHFDRITIVSAVPEKKIYLLGMDYT